MKIETLNGKSVLVTGGSGSFGKAFVKNVLEKYPDIKKLIIYSRDEQKHYQMSKIFPFEKYNCMRYFVGDVRDYQRLKLATDGVDIIVHAAAMKHVPIAEENPMECIKTNILGAQNVIDVALENNIQKVVALSTDKASSPINLYGATKLCADKLFTAANNLRFNKCFFSVVRYGNVFGSNGSVIPFFLKEREKGEIPITDKNMTRFNITLDEAVDLVIFTIKNSIGGEIIVPKIPSYKLVDLVEAISPSSKIKYIGVRPGEKIHEEMISTSESSKTIDIGKYYVILPTMSNLTNEDYINHYNAKFVEKDFCYSSSNNTEWLTIEDIRKMLNTKI